MPDNIQESHLPRYLNCETAYTPSEHQSIRILNPLFLDSSLCIQALAFKSLHSSLCIQAFAFKPPRSPIPWTNVLRANSQSRLGSAEIEHPAGLRDLRVKQIHQT